MNAEKIEKQEQLIDFIRELNLNDLFISEIKIQFNRDKYLENAKKLGKVIEYFQVVNENFSDEYRITNINMLTNKQKIDYGLLEK